jgi:hypothetical protein
MTIAQQFARNRYHIVRAIVPDATRNALYEYALEEARSGKTKSDQFIPNTPAVYASTPTDELLESLLPVVERLAGVALFPTYSYFRVYKNGDVLPPHVDRPSCEISLSVSLGFEAATPWPFFVEGPNGVCRAELFPGDALLYRGCECKHWRERFEGHHAAQVFLHYVAKDGPNASYKFDRRPSLAHRRADTQPA